MNTEISIEFFPPQTPEGVEKLRAVRENPAPFAFVPPDPSA